MMFSAVVIYGQWTPEGFGTSPKLEARDSSKITVKANVIGFFKNNEYVSPIAKGKTLPGVQFEPTVGYQIGTRIRAEIGFYGVYYSGDELEHGDLLIGNTISRIQYSPDAAVDLHLILGNYYGGLNHRLIEPMYAWERHLNSKPESGFQLLLEKENIFMDAWVNWSRYIEYGDSVPEILTVGLSSSMKVPSFSTERLKITIPFQMLIYHEGGQIDVSNTKMIVAGNLAAGICSEYQLGDRFFKSVGFNFYALGYYDKLPNKDMRPYNKGWALYPTLQVDASPFKASVGYWRAHKYFSFMGEPLLNSFNMYYPGQVIPDRNLLVAKFLFSRQVCKEFTWGGHLETYSELRGEFKTNYSFGLYMRFNTRFF